MDSTIRPLLNHLFDYAGLFPPAKLSMEETVRNYANYRDASRSWMLGRIIVPLARLGEFEDAACSIGGRWSLSVIGQGDWEEDLEAIRRFNSLRTDQHDFSIDCLERRFSSADRSPQQLDGVAVYCEVSPSDEGAFATLQSHGLMAKVRCGGLDRSAFPSDAALAEFIIQCYQRSIPFKATAGLHHPLKSTRAATDAENADVVEMHGFLNLTIAVCLLHAGLIEPSQVKDVLAAHALNSFEFSPTQVRWQDKEIDVDQIESARTNFFHGLGSCSFIEPIEDLEQLKLLA